MHHNDKKIIFIYKSNMDLIQEINPSLCVRILITLEVHPTQKNPSQRFVEAQSLKTVNEETSNLQI